MLKDILRDGLQLPNVAIYRCMRPTQVLKDILRDGLQLPNEYLKESRAEAVAAVVAVS